MSKSKFHKQIYPYADRSGMRGILLDVFENFERPIIGYNWNLGGYTPWPKVSRKYYLLSVSRMKNKGWVKEVERNGKRFLRITSKGKVRVLLSLIQTIKQPARSTWDRKWRIAMFDIPEQGRRERDKIRWILRKVGFHRLQKSVYVYPYALPVEAVQYLKESGLDQFIRFMRVDRVDNEKDLRRRFKL